MVLDNSLLLSHNNDEFTKKEMQIDYMQLETLILSLKRNDSILGNSLSMLWNMSQISVLNVGFLLSALWLDQMTMNSQSNLTCRWSRSGPKPVYQSVSSGSMTAFGATMPVLPACSSHCDQGLVDSD